MPEIFLKCRLSCCCNSGLLRLSIQNQLFQVVSYSRSFCLVNAYMLFKQAVVAISKTITATGITQTIIFSGDGHVRVGVLRHHGRSSLQTN